MSYTLEMIFFDVKRILIRAVLVPVYGQIDLLDIVRDEI